MKNELLCLCAGLSSLVAVACGSGAGKNNAMIHIDNTLTEQEAANGVLTPEVMWKLGRVSQSALSPDGHTTVWVTTRYDVGQNRGYTFLRLHDIDTAFSLSLTDGQHSASSPRWNGDGSVLYFLSDRSGSPQVWKMDIILSRLTRDRAAPQPLQVTDIEGGIEGFDIAPAENNLLYIKRVKVDGKRAGDKYPDMDKSAALIYDDLLERHWDRWEDGTHLHIFTAPMAERITSGKDIMEGEAWDSPMAPYFDQSEVSFSNSGTMIAYTCKKMTGLEYTLSTDSDIYLYDISSGKTENLTAGMLGYDRYPRFSPDDKRLAFTSMERAGNESDLARLMVLDLQGGAKSELTAGFDHSAEHAEWSDDNLLFFVSAINGTLTICSAGVDKPGEVTVHVYGPYDVNRFSVHRGRMVAEICSLSAPVELFEVEPFSGQISQFTTENTDIVSVLKMGEVKKYMVPTTDGKEMLTWVVVPPDFDPAKKYPLLLYCQGGPQSTVSQFWSYRWNLQLMAAKGYVVVAPNRRGTPSFGREWLDQISGDYSGQNIRDYLSAIDLVSAEPWADRSRMGCVGASYGGYSTFYLAGHHEKRFKAFIAHCGMFNLESQYGETDELWFVNNDLGGPWWSDDETAKRSYANSPHRFVKNWDSPIMIITGANDFRIPYTESLQAFTAARVMGLPSRLVFFEDEGHQVFKPQNSLVWNREFFSWLDKYVKQTED